MLRRFGLSVAALVIALLVLAPGRPAAASGPEPEEYAPTGWHLGDAEPPDLLAEQSTPPDCDDLARDDRRLELEEFDLSPTRRFGFPYPLLCVFYYPSEDVYRGIILGIDGMEHFRAAKGAAVDRLLAGGFDVCGIATWGWWGSYAARQVTADDELALPVECHPRVVAADGGGMARLGEVQAAVARIVELTAEQMGWRPYRPMRVVVFTDPGVAVTFYRRYRGSDQSAEDAERRARGGGSWNTAYLGPMGGVIALNLVRRDWEYLDTKLAHEYTHYAQHGLGGSAGYFPMWFVEGQGAYQEERNGLPRVDFLSIARREQRAGRAYRVAELATREDWFAREARPGGGEAVYSRGYAAVRFLAERYGFGATAQLLRDNRNGSIGQFNQLLAALTGMDLDTLDAAIGAWLLGGPIPVTASVATSPGPAQAGVATLPPANVWFVGTEEHGAFRLEFTTSPGGFEAAGTLRIERDIDCGNNRLVRADGASAFTLTIHPDGTVSWTSTDGPTVSLDGRFVTATELRGTFRYVNPDTGCDTGPLPYTARPS